MRSCGLIELFVQKPNGVYVSIGVTRWTFEPPVKDQAFNIYSFNDKFILLGEEYVLSRWVAFAMELQRQNRNPPMMSLGRATTTTKFVFSGQRRTIRIRIIDLLRISEEVEHGRYWDY